MCCVENADSSQTETYEVVQMDNRKIVYTERKCQYHIIFIPKYRKKYCMVKVEEYKKIR